MVWNRRQYTMRILVGFDATLLGEGKPVDLYKAGSGVAARLSSLYIFVRSSYLLLALKINIPLDQEKSTMTCICVLMLPLLCVSYDDPLRSRASFGPRISAWRLCFWSTKEKASYIFAGGTKHLSSSNCEVLRTM